MKPQLETFCGHEKTLKKHTADSINLVSFTEAGEGHLPMAMSLLAAVT